MAVQSARSISDRDFAPRGRSSVPSVRPEPTDVEEDNARRKDALSQKHREQRCEGVSGAYQDRHPCRGGFRALLSGPLRDVANRHDGWRPYMCGPQYKVRDGSDLAFAQRFPRLSADLMLR